MEAKPKRTGRWLPGQSGNPRGRPPGLGKVAKLREVITAAVPDIVAALIDQAKAGDTQAAKLLLERAIPAVRPESLPLPLPLPEGAGLGEQGAAILAAVRDGQVGIHEASALLSAIGAHARAVEVHELIRRIELLERGSAGEPE